MGGAGYPLLFQSGEHGKGKALVWTASTLTIFLRRSA